MQKTLKKTGSYNILKIANFCRKLMIDKNHQVLDPDLTGRDYDLKPPLVL